jgi:prepilin-type N-terminal cleavage/methylation domain-containing protein
MSAALQRLRRFTAGHGRGRGFTLIEVLAVCAIGVLLAGLAWPSYRGQWLRAGRSEAMQALDHLQAAQERHREMFGRYAADLATVGLGPATENGRYVLALVPTGAESYRAEAVVRTGGAQDGDRQCHALTIDVRQGFTTQGPDGRCWNR